MYHVDIKIHDLALLKDEASDFRRTENLFTCFRAIRSFLEIWLAMTPHDFLDLPFPMFCQAGHCLIVLYKLTVFEDPMWDREYVRNTLDVLTTLDTMVDTLYQAAKIIGDDNEMVEQNFLTKGCRVMAQMRAGWASKLETPSTVLPITPATNHTEEPASDMFADLMSDRWLTDMLATWDG